jgi:tetratricopeptide (TPR) repeat protein
MLRRISPGARAISPRAAALFERTLELQPNEIAAAFWLGDIYLAQEIPMPLSAVSRLCSSGTQLALRALRALGRTALAKQRIARRRVPRRRACPRSAGGRRPLPAGPGVQRLGDARKAELHLKQRREHDILPADPLMVELDGLLQSAQTYETLGIRALDQQDWNEAAAQFRRGLDLEPENAALRHRLGTALYMRGEHAAARAEFERAIRASPGFARAYYSLGVLVAAQGQHAEAIQYFSTALRREADYAEAHQAGGQSSAVQRPGESLAHYEQVLTANPANVDARIGQCWRWCSSGGT